MALLRRAGTAMVKVQQQGDTVIFTAEGLPKLGALRSELRMPRAHIKSARHGPEAGRAWGLREPGTYVPGLLKAGTFYLADALADKPTLRDVQHREQVVVVALVDERYHLLIIEVADPAAVVALLS